MTNLQIMKEMFTEYGATVGECIEYLDSQLHDRKIVCSEYNRTAKAFRSFVAKRVGL